MKATPLLGTLVALALALSGCGRKTPCSIARAKIATDARVAKATKVTVKSPPPPPIARIPLALTGNAEADLIASGDSANGAAAADFGDLLVADAPHVDAFEKALPDRLEAVATGIESSDAKTAKDKLRALLAEDATAKTARGKKLFDLQQRDAELKTRYQGLVAAPGQTSAAGVERIKRQLAQAEALYKQLDSAVADNAKDEHSFATLESDLEAVTAACAKK